MDMGWKMLLELLGDWGDMAHVVKGMWAKEGFGYWREDFVLMV